MRTNIVLDDELVDKAFRVSEAKTKKDLVHEALRELIRIRARRPLTDLAGQLRLARGYDYKRLRSSR
jgi:Arc/MetJ family transcription regulator